MVKWSTFVNIFKFIRNLKRKTSAASAARRRGQRVRPLELAIEHSATNGFTAGASLLNVDTERSSAIAKTATPRSTLQPKRLLGFRSQKTTKIDMTNFTNEESVFHGGGWSLTRELAFGHRDPAKPKMKNTSKSRSITFFTPSDKRAKLITLLIVAFFLIIFVFFWYKGREIDAELVRRCFRVDNAGSSLWTTQCTGHSHPAVSTPAL